MNINGSEDETPSTVASLTVVITTSPTPSNPSTDLLSSVLDSFRQYCTSLLECPVIIVFDTFDRIAPQPRLKKGVVNPEGAKHFEEYKHNAKALLLRSYQGLEDPKQQLLSRTAEAEFGSPGKSNNFVPLQITQTADKHITFIEPTARLGFGLAVRSALRIAETPYVWIQQHDWPLVSKIPIDLLLEAMRDSEGERDAPPIKYICLPSIRMLSYATSSHVMEFPSLRALTSTLKRDYVPKSAPEVTIPLTPLFLWHDKPHIAQRVHYLARVFPSRFAMKRGEFIEDTIGLKARSQMKDGLWSKWACWLYCPGEGRELCLRHLKGRTWKGTQEGAKQAEDAEEWNTSSRE